MPGPRVPHQRVPYLEHCPYCREPEPVRVRPLFVQPAPEGRGVVADYLCPDGHLWFTGWQRDSAHDRWAS
jgi:hypothetical protein